MNLHQRVHRNEFKGRETLSVFGNIKKNTLNFLMMLLKRVFRLNFNRAMCRNFSSQFFSRTREVFTVS